MIVTFVSSAFIAIFAIPLFIIFGLTLLLASIGQTFGIRKLYVESLLKLFEYARQCSITKKETKAGFHIGDDDSDDEDLAPLCLLPSSKLNQNGNIKSDFKISPNKEKQGRTTADLESRMLKNRKERAISRHNVISRRDNLILTPSKPELQRIDSLQEDEIDGIVEDSSNSLPNKILSGKCVSLGTFQQDFELSDVFDYMKTGVASIIEDEVTSRFVAEELKNWNLMTRTHSQFEFINWRITAFYIGGWFFRYCLLFPSRFVVGFVGMAYLVISCITLSCIPHQGLRNWLYERVALVVFQCLSRCFSAEINFHDLENRPGKDGICVANHTSPIDVIILSVDQSYALVGQSHGGLLGLVQRSLSRAAAHIWFERSEMKDRKAVSQRLRDHVEDPSKLPILIFPEGTCINNTSVMQFKKGSFEVGGVIYPVAIKYNPKFGEAFWNSSRYSMSAYLLMMMTSWAIVCDVWYLPPMKMKEGESAIDFANRVKRQIALKGGLVDLLWDGNLKRSEVKNEWKEAQQQQFSRRIRVD